MAVLFVRCPKDERKDAYPTALRTFFRPNGALRPAVLSAGGDGRPERLTSMRNLLIDSNAKVRFFGGIAFASTTSVQGY
jgi:hypothetical protein